MRYTKTVVEKFNPDDPAAPPEIEEHHCFTFTYSGDLEIKPGSVLAFTGPCAPQGLMVESVTEGPWFTVLGKTSRSHGDQHQSSDDDWHKWMGPNTKPFYVYVSCPLPCDWLSLIVWRSESSTENVQGKFRRIRTAVQEQQDHKHVLLEGSRRAEC